MTYYTAIIYTNIPQVNNAQFMKYRNIPSTGERYNKFLIFAKAFPGVDHINFYDKRTRKYSHQVRFDEYGNAVEKKPGYTSTIVLRK